MSQRVGERLGFDDAGSGGGSNFPAEGFLYVTIIDPTFRRTNQD